MAPISKLAIPRCGQVRPTVEPNMVILLFTHFFFFPLWIGNYVALSGYPLFILSRTHMRLCCPNTVLLW